MGRILKYDKTKDALEDFPLIIQASYLAIKNLGGDADIDDIEDEVIEMLHLTDEQIERYDEEEEQTVLEYNLAWARTYLKRWGAIEREYPGHWAITPAYGTIDFINQLEAEDIDKYDGNRPEDYDEFDYEDENEEAYNTEESIDKNALLQTVRKLPPENFEKLCADILTAEGFEHAENTPYVKDGGIDGTAKCELLGQEISVIFQCKKYKDDWTVRLKEINEFIGCERFNEGAIKIYFTSGKYTNAALERAHNENITTIDQDSLIDLIINNDLKIDDYL